MSDHIRAENGTSLYRFLLQVCGKRKLVYLHHFRPPAGTVKQKRAGAVFERSAKDGGKALGKRVLYKQNPKQELYKDVQFLPA